MGGPESNLQAAKYVWQQWWVGWVLTKYKTQSINLRLCTLHFYYSTKNILEKVIVKNDKVWLGYLLYCFSCIVNFIPDASGDAQGRQQFSFWNLFLVACDPTTMRSIAPIQVVYPLKSNPNHLYSRRASNHWDIGYLGTYCCSNINIKMSD